MVHNAASKLRSEIQCFSNTRYRRHSCFSYSKSPSPLVYQGQYFVLLDIAVTSGLSRSIFRFCFGLPISSHPSVAAANLCPSFVFVILRDSGVLDESELVVFPFAPVGLPEGARQPIPTSVSWAPPQPNERAISLVAVFRRFRRLAGRLEPLGNLEGNIVQSDPSCC